MFNGLQPDYSQIITCSSLSTNIACNIYSHFDIHVLLKTCMYTLLKAHVPLSLFIARWLWMRGFCKVLVKIANLVVKSFHNFSHLVRRYSRSTFLLFLYICTCNSSMCLLYSTTYAR